MCGKGDPFGIVQGTIQFSMNTQFNCQNTFLFKAIQFSQTALIQTIQFSNSIVFVHTQLNVKNSLVLFDP